MLEQQHLRRGQVLRPVERHMGRRLEDHVAEGRRHPGGLDPPVEGGVVQSFVEARQLEVHQVGQDPEAAADVVPRQVGGPLDDPGQVEREDLGRGLQPFRPVVVVHEVDRVVGAEEVVHAEPVADVGEGPVVVEPHVQPVLHPEGAAKSRVQVPGGQPPPNTSPASRTTTRYPRCASSSGPSPAMPPPTTSAARRPGRREHRWQDAGVPRCHVHDPAALVRRPQLVQRIRGRDRGPRRQRRDGRHAARHTTPRRRPRPRHP